MAQILWFENYQPGDAPELGGKNASLGTLTGTGSPAPSRAPREVFLPPSTAASAGW